MGASMVTPGTSEWLRLHVSVPRNERRFAAPSVSALSFGFMRVMFIGFTAAAGARTGAATPGICWGLLDLQGRLGILMRCSRAALPDGRRRLGRCGHADLLAILLITLMRGVLLGVGALPLLVRVVVRVVGSLRMQSRVGFGIGPWSLWTAIGGRNWRKLAHSTLVQLLDAGCFPRPLAFANRWHDGRFHAAINGFTACERSNIEPLSGSCLRFSRFQCASLSVPCRWRAHRGALDNWTIDLDRHRPRLFLMDGKIDERPSRASAHFTEQCRRSFV